MYKTILTILILLTANLINAQTSYFLTIRHIKTDIGIKNVNVIIPRFDTTLVTDTAGMVDLSGFQNLDTLIIKKFGYKNLIATDFNGQIRLQRDTTLYSHNLKLLDLQPIDGASIIKLMINEEIYYFKQNVGPLYLGNGIELESPIEYINIIQDHKIIKTISVLSEECIYNIIGENSANWIMAIYYDPKLKKKKSKYIPNTLWYSKRKNKKDAKILKLTGGCLD